MERIMISSSELNEWLNWKNLVTRMEFNKTVLVYSILKNGNAPCLRQEFSARSNNTSDYNLRNYGTDFSIPKFKTMLPDLKKAFDIVDHEIQLHQLYLYRTNGIAFNWFRSCFSNRK